MAIRQFNAMEKEFPRLLYNLGQIEKKLQYIFSLEPTPDSEEMMIKLYHVKHRMLKRKEYLEPKYQQFRSMYNPGYTQGYVNQAFSAYMGLANAQTNAMTQNQQMQNQLMQQQIAAQQQNMYNRILTSGDPTCTKTQAKK